MNFWILPSDLNQFDIVSRMSAHRFVYWKQHRPFAAGDIVWIYDTGAVEQIRYATVVESDDRLDDHVAADFPLPYADTGDATTETMMKLRLLQEIRTDALSRSSLQEHGWRGSFQEPTIVKGELLDYVLDHLNRSTRDYIQRASMYGEFRSWVILSDHTIVKMCDLSWFKNHGSSVAQETRWFWGADRLEYPEQKPIRFHIGEAYFDAKITTDNASGSTRTRLFWNSDCATLFNTLVDYRERETKICMAFEKEGNDTYKATFINDYTAMAAQEFNIRKIMDTLSASGLIFDPGFVQRYICSLLTKPFVILSGLTGSGKTLLAMAFPKLICKDSRQYKLIPVGADWTNREHLLGYPNALRPGEYVMPDNGALELILEASKAENQDKPYFLVLDEMNMSYVERYFADFLSAMESGEPIPLWTGNDEVPASITLPKNLFIIGTINVDETTYMFSPKVLDRANVIEFRINRQQMMEYLDSSGTITPLGDCSERAADFVAIAHTEYAGSLSEEMKSTLLDMFDTLGSIQKEFGYRTAHEMSRYITITQCFTNMTEHESIDSAIVQKLLPKIHGSRKKIMPILKALWKICYRGEAVEIDAMEAFPSTDTFTYPISAEKIWRMYQIAQDNGFTSFAEA